MNEVQRDRAFKKYALEEEVFSLCDAMERGGSATTTSDDDFMKLMDDDLRQKVQRLLDRRAHRRARNPILVEATPRTDTQRVERWAEELEVIQQANGNPSWMHSRIRSDDFSHGHWAAKARRKELAKFTFPHGYVWQFGARRERERERKREREERAREGVRRGCQLGRESGATLRLGSWDQ